MALRGRCSSYREDDSARLNEGRLSAMVGLLDRARGGSGDRLRASGDLFLGSGSLDLEDLRSLFSSPA